jgi:uncharacterized protein (DUF2062 family)
MPRHLLKRYMPDPASIRQHKSLRFLGRLLQDANLWHLNRRSVSRAMAIGLFAAFLPVPMQMLVAACLAIPARANLPIATGLVWITNPLTMPFVFYCTYRLGAWVLDTPPRHLPESISLDWITSQFGSMWQPFLLGSVLTGLIMGALGFGLTLLYWRWWVARQWRRRRQRGDGDA